MVVVVVVEGIIGRERCWWRCGLHGVLLWLHYYSILLFLYVDIEILEKEKSRRLDFSYNSNNWGIGLPPREKNERNWPLIQPRLADPDFKPHKSEIVAAVESFLTFLQIRYSSPLFRLRTANAIQERVKFHNTGPSWIPGVIVMSIEDGYEGVPGLTQMDECYSFVVVIFNACPTEVLFSSPVLRARTLQLHPMQLRSSDDIVKKSKYEASSGCFTVPARTSSVFVESRDA